MAIKCPRCGLFSPPEALVCDCGLIFATSKLKPGVVFNRRVGPGVRVSLFVLAWMSAFGILTILRGRELWPFWIYFPIGLLSEVSAILGEPPGIGDQARHAVLLGWVVYVVLAYPIFLTRTRRTFFVAYAVLCIALAVNVAGCHTAGTR
jgi:hypothetical protein